MALFQGQNIPITLFQIIGTQGATNLDAAEETHYRMDNFQVAVDMTEEGKDAKTIRFATGWEKGVDGKWRYEIDDTKFKTDFVYKSIEFRKENPRYEELENKLEELNYNWEKLTKEEQEEFEKLSDKFNEGYYKNEATLEEILDAPELFKSYPEFKKVVVKFKYNPGEVAGRYLHGKIIDEFFEIEENYHEIEINTLPNSDNEEKIKSILLHEIQHAIQRIEGFAKGGNIEQFKKEIEKRNPLTKAQEKLVEDVDVYNKNVENKEQFTLLDFMKGQIKFDNKEGLYDDDFIKSYLLSEEDILSAYNQNKAKLEKFKNELKNEQSSFDKYYSLAGEVEARNVQTRMTLTSEERQQKLLAETMDIARDQQIIMFQTLQDEAQQAIENVREQYINTDKWLKAPNGNDTNLTEKQWLQVRTPQFKAWFGDWELKHKESNIVQLNEAPFYTKESGIKWAMENNIIGVMSNEETKGKGEINISKSSIDEMLNASQRNKSNTNNVHYATLTKIKEIIKESTIVDTHPSYNKDKNGKRTPLAGINENVFIDVLYGAIRFNEEIYRVKTTVKRYIDKNATSKAYAYSVEKIEVLAGTLSNDTKATTPNASTSISNKILLEGIRKVNKKTGEQGELCLDDYSKVVDENGEPLVVFHGTPLSRSKTTKNKGWQKDESGNDIYIRQEMPFSIFRNGNYNGLIFFSEDYDKAKDIADKRSMNIPDNEEGKEEWTEEGYVYYVYLKAKKPFNILDEELTNRVLDKIETIEAYNYYTNQLREITKDEAKKILKGDNSWRVAETKEFLNIIKEQGYDALQAKDDGYLYTAVFTPNQIKSASDNSGEFNANNPSILHQTQHELIEDAKSFESWQDFMEYYETFGIPEVSPIPNDADSQWYQTFWELAKGLTPEQQTNEEIQQQQIESDNNSDNSPAEMDALWLAILKKMKK